MLYNSYETERLLLRPTTSEDAPFVLALLNSPKWIKNIGKRDVNTEKEAEEYIRLKMTPQLERLGYSNYTVIRKSDGVKMGSCGLYDREGLSGIDIGFALLPPYEKQGYGFEASSRIMKAGIEDFGLTEIQGITSKDNVASHKLLEKIGLTFEKLITLPNDNEEIMLFRFRKRE